MLGASTRLETAVGSRPKLNTIKTSTTKTTAERIPVRARNSTTRSLAAAVQACRSALGTGIAILLRDLQRVSAAPRRQMHESPRAHERDVRRELRPLFDVVCHQNRRTTLFHHVAQKAAKRFCRDAIETGELLLEQHEPRVGDPGPCATHTV